MLHEAELIDDSLAVVKVSRDMRNGSRELINEKQKSLFIDFGNVNTCPSLVWGSLLVLSKQARKSELKNALCSLRPTMAKSVRIIGIAQYTNVYSEKSEAVKVLRKENENE